MTQSATATLVNRRSRYLRRVHLPLGHNAERCRIVMQTVLARLHAAALLTLTWGQGTQMANHDRITAHFAEGSPFAHPGGSWLRDNNENTNSLLAPALPEAGGPTDLHSADLAHAELRLSNRPRKDPRLAHAARDIHRRAGTAIAIGVATTPGTRRRLGHTTQVLLATLDSRGMGLSAVIYAIPISRISPAPPQPARPVRSIQSSMAQASVK